MITFVHLSDIHFLDRDSGTQFDIDQQIRRALLEDLESKPADGASYDGLLIAGDIAFGGKYEEYKRAQEWLDSVFSRTQTAASATCIVPGNHDVDRKFVEPDIPLWAAHVALREAKDPTDWHDRIYKQLVRDPLRSLMAPLNGYNDFALRYGCFSGMVKEVDGTEKPQLAWQRIFEKSLDDGSRVRLHGLNSALISDKADAPGNLLVSKFQTSHFERTPGIIDVTMCHHPPEWLMDKADVRNALRSFSPIALFGHEHDTRILADADQVQLFAGAVQPSRRDPAGWLPTYHILQLTVAAHQTERQLLVRIHTREFDKENYIFRARRNKHDQPVDEHHITLPRWSPPVSPITIPVASGTKPELSSTVVKGMPATDSTPKSTETGQRELLAHFFHLGSPDRYAAANDAKLLRDGDDALNPQVMWAEVFRRAVQENRLARFWAAVASRTPALKEVPNPFGT